MRVSPQVIPLFALDKRCPHCREMKPMSAFFPDPRKKNGSTYCRKCDGERKSKRLRNKPPEEQAVRKRRVSEYSKKWREGKTPEQKEAYAQASFALRVQRDYGITVEEARAILARQSGLCGNRACGKELSFDVNGRHHRGKVNTGVQRAFIDHCHATGKVRGVLCDHCNKAEGFYEKNKNLLLGIFEYLQRSVAK